MQILLIFLKCKYLRLILIRKQLVDSAIGILSSRKIFLSIFGEVIFFGGVILLWIVLARPCQDGIYIWQARHDFWIYRTRWFINSVIWRHFIFLLSSFWRNACSCNPNSCNLYFCNLQFAFLTSLHLSSFDPTYFNFKSFSFSIYLKFLFPLNFDSEWFFSALLISTQPSNSKEWSFEKVLVNMITKIPCDRFG